MKLLYGVGLLYVATSVAMITRPELFATPSRITVANASGTWFERAKPFCNTVEVDAFHHASPPPDDLYGTGFSAACYALAGRIGRAREIIRTLPVDEQYKGAGIVFNVAHPVADMGDDEAAGPIMALVVEFWPNHYQALYHAGMARYATGDLDAALDYLTAFLAHYDIDDGFTANAKTVLARLDAR